MTDGNIVVPAEATLDPLKPDKTIDEVYMLRVQPIPGTIRR
jgi:hypothetical protein